MRQIWHILKRLFLYIFLTAATITMAFPLFWMISSSLKTVDQTNSAGIVWFPPHPTLQAYIDIFHNEIFPALIF